MYMLECQLIKGEIHQLATTILIMGFPSGSDSKKSTCNAGDLGSIPGSGRSPGGGHSNPLQYSWAFLEAQMIKNPPAMQKTWVQSLGWKIPWRRAWRLTPVFLPGKSHRQRSLVGYSPWGRQEENMTEQLSILQTEIIIYWI